MKKFLVFILIASMLFAMGMSGCANTADDGKNTSGSTLKNSGGSSSATKPGSIINSTLDDMLEGSNSSSGSISSGSMSSAGSLGSNGINGSTNKGKGSFMFNSKLYTVTDESIDKEKLDVQLTSIVAGVTGIPSKDGEAVGLDSDTKIYRIKDSQDDKEVAVEIDGRYFKAEQDNTKE